MTKHIDDVLGHYANYFKAWQPKLLGPKPERAMFDAVHKLGARPGKQALANAMAMRDCGVTGAQIVIACGAPQLNKMRGFITDGLLKREAVPANGAGHTVYKLTLTAKGKGKVDKVAVATDAAKPAKAKRKAKAKPAEAPVAAPVAVTEAPAEAQPQA